MQKVLAASFLLLALALRPSTAPAQAAKSPDYSSYLAHIAAASSALRLNEGPEAKRWVDAAPLAHRGWEWRYLWSRTQSDELFALRGHSNDVPIALFLHDGRTAFSGSSDHTLKFWNLSTRSVVDSIP